MAPDEDWLAELRAAARENAGRGTDDPGDIAAQPAKIAERARTADFERELDEDRAYFKQKSTWAIPPRGAVPPPSSAAQFSIGPLLLGLSLLGYVATTLAAVAAAAWAGVNWLRDAYWPIRRLVEYLPIPRVEGWQGVNEIAAWVWLQPLAIGIFVLGSAASTGVLILGLVFRDE